MHNPSHEKKVGFTPQTPQAGGKLLPSSAECLHLLFPALINEGKVTFAKNHPG